MLHGYNNEKGIALLTTLMLMVLGLAVVITLLVLSTQGTRITGLEQRYTTALDAAKGGGAFITSMLQNGVSSLPALADSNNVASAFFSSEAGGELSSECFRQKMTTAPSAENWSRCDKTDTRSTNAYACATSPDPTICPDVSLSLSSYTVAVKIVDTRVTPNYFFFTINVRATVPGTREHAEISMLYRMENPM